VAAAGGGGEQVRCSELGSGGEGTREQKRGFWETAGGVDMAALLHRECKDISACFSGVPLSQPQLTVGSWQGFKLLAIIR
jgi:hypothetical protein